MPSDMTAALTAINPAPHLLDPVQTMKAAREYAAKWYGTRELLERAIAAHLRAIEHEEAIVAGYALALEEMELARQK